MEPHELQFQAKACRSKLRDGSAPRRSCSFSPLKRLAISVNSWKTVMPLWGLRCAGICTAEAKLREHNRAGALRPLWQAPNAARSIDEPRSVLARAGGGASVSCKRPQRKAEARAIACGPASPHTRQRFNRILPPESTGSTRATVCV